MNIPHKYLVNNSLSEKKKKFYEKLTSSYKRAFIEYRKKYNNNDTFYKKVMNWLFSQNEETRMILCSVENKKYTNTIHEAYAYLTQIGNNIKFIITDDDDNGGERFKLEVMNEDYNTYYYKDEYTDFRSYKSLNEFQKTQKNFYDNIVFYQCESPIDDIKNYSNYFTFNPEFLKNEENFKKQCKILTYNNFLCDPIMTKKEVQNKINILSFELPNWISKYNYQQK